ncbi:MAG: helix-turn-helix transcriptional regulator [Oscillospiraceae bacterium]|nr:helix-turn-helix transcriptional regulator [Oscillospiraceae bacterium]
MQILYVERGVKIVDFGTRLKNLRKQAGLTQQQLATQLGITKSVVSFYELQERSPSPDVLVKLAVIFHVSADYLLGLDTRETIDVSDLDEKDVQAVRAIVERLRDKKLPPL